MGYRKGRAWGRHFSLCFWSLIYRNLLIPAGVEGGGEQTSLIAHSGLYANNFRGERGEEIIRALSGASNEPRHDSVMRQKWI